MNPKRRMFWQKHLHRWHWISAAVCLAGILLFSLTGITLNHAAAIEARPKVTTRTAQLPTALLASIASPRAPRATPLPEAVQDWLSGQIGLRTRNTSAEWSADEVYVSLPRPGADAWLTIDRRSGAVEYERTDRGMVALLNDLHKGRHAGAVWGGLIDALGAACLVFSLTGLFLLQFGARRRPATWPLIGFGAAAMILIAVVFIH